MITSSQVQFNNKSAWTIHIITDAMTKTKSPSTQSNWSKSVYLAPFVILAQDDVDTYSGETHFARYLCVYVFVCTTVCECVIVLVCLHDSALKYNLSLSRVILFLEINKSIVCVTVWKGYAVAYRNAQL